jgi:hypothetical protein
VKLADEADAKIWKRIQEIALTSPHLVVPLTKEPDVAKQFGLLKDECRRTIESPGPDEVYWTSSPMKFFFDRYEAEIKGWLLANIPQPAKMREADRKGIFQ